MGDSLQINIVAELSKATKALPVAVKHTELTILEAVVSLFVLSVMLMCPT